MFSTGPLLLLLLLSPICSQYRKQHLGCANANVTSHLLQWFSISRLTYLRWWWWRVHLFLFISKKEKQTLLLFNWIQVFCLVPQCHTDMLNIRGIYSSNTRISVTWAIGQIRAEQKPKLPLFQWRREYLLFFIILSQNTCVLSFPTF